MDNDNIIASVNGDRRTAALAAVLRELDNAIEIIDETLNMLRASAKQMQGN